VTGFFKALSSTLLALVAAGCASNPHYVYPMLPRPDDRERTLTCEQLDDDILRSDAVRWSMRIEGMKVRTSTTNAWMAMAMIPFFAVGGVPPFVPDLGPQAHLIAADARVVGLLEIKRSRGCPARATADPTVTDLDVLGQLQASEADWKAKKISEKTALANRMRLLDGLCDPQTIRASAKETMLPGP